MPYPRYDFHRTKSKPVKPLWSSTPGDGELQPGPGNRHHPQRPVRPQPDQTLPNLETQPCLLRPPVTVKGPLHQGQRRDRRQIGNRVGQKTAIRTHPPIASWPGGGGQSWRRMTGRLGNVRPISVNPAAVNMANVPVNRADPLTRDAASLSTSTG